MRTNDIDDTLTRLLGVRLTAFQFGLVSGLKGHPNPSREQRDMLERVCERYPGLFMPAQKHTERHETKERPNAHLHTTHPAGV